MSDENPIVTWLVRLGGHPADLSDAAKFANAAPLVNVVEENPDGLYYLRSDSFDGLTDGLEVFYRGNDLLTRINGALNAYLDGYRPIVATGVVSVHANGRRTFVDLRETLKGHVEG